MTTLEPSNHEEQDRLAKLFGYQSPRRCIMRKDVKTKLGVAFRQDERVTVYEGKELIDCGPYRGQKSYVAYSRLNRCLTAIRPSTFKAGF